MMQGDSAAKHELDRMLSDLSRLREELPDLERDGKESTGATNARRAISRLEQGIRRHCRDHRLMLPESVPLGFETASVTIDHDAISTVARSCVHY